MSPTDGFMVDSVIQVLRVNFSFPVIPSQTLQRRVVNAGEQRHETRPVLVVDTDADLIIEVIIGQDNAKFIGIRIKLQVRINARDDI